MEFWNDQSMNFVIKKKKHLNAYQNPLWEKKMSWENGSLVVVQYFRILQYSIKCILGDATAKAFHQQKRQK